MELIYAIKFSFIFGTEFKKFFVLMSRPVIFLVESIGPRVESTKSIISSLSQLSSPFSQISVFYYLKALLCISNKKCDITEINRLNITLFHSFLIGGKLLDLRQQLTLGSLSSLHNSVIFFAT